MVPLTGKVGWNCVWKECGAQCVISAGATQRHRLSADSLDSQMLVCSVVCSYVCRGCLKKLFTSDEGKKV